jgi:3',5'-nucleoside bisphosphate phosphatase
MKFADLHLHTFFSDGTYSPSELIRQAERAGLSALAVVDHDTVEGIPSLIESARICGIEVLPGIELTAQYERLEVHILGYLFDYENQALLQQLESLRKIRVERVYKIAEKLRGIGVPLDPAVVFSLSGSGTVGRLHVARALVKEKLVSCIEQAFKKYIGDRSPAYVSGFKLSPQEAVTLIKEAGGIPVLAHPYTITNDDVLLKIITCGIMGLEVHYPEHSQAMVNFYLRLAQQYRLLVTGGSDCHGNAKSEVRIGSMKIPYDLVEKLKQAKADLTR